MSNIIDGIDYGMGYEPTKEYAPNIEWWDKGDNTWSETCWSNQESLAAEIARHGTVYRRPLPIISQHPGAIPLEPGEELIEGECYLMRDGRLTGPMPCDGHEAFPFGVDGTPDTWHRDGSCWDNALSRNDIIARLPKVEQKGEKKMENLIDIGAVHYADFHGTPANFRIPIIEATRIAQLPEVIAEVERQRAEKEIKVGDWFWTKSGTPDRAHAIGIEKPEVLGQTDKWHKVQDCPKITDPAFIALLERGA